MDETTLVSNTTEYNQTYYRHHKAAIDARRATRQRTLVGDPEVLARGPWLRSRLRLHGVTLQALAHLLGCTVPYVASWLCAPERVAWAPLSQKRMAQIDRLLPAEAPMKASVLDLLDWPPLRRMAYQAQWQAGAIPVITSQMVTDWCEAHGYSQYAVCRVLGLSITALCAWKSGEIAIPAKHQRILWWLMQTEDVQTKALLKDHRYKGEGYRLKKEERAEKTS